MLRLRHCMSLRCNGHLQHHMARKIAFINDKGGVGKTSLIVNVAACLAKAGKRVLLCDFDTQSNASIWLLSSTVGTRSTRR